MSKGVFFKATVRSAVAAAEQVSSRLTPTRRVDHSFGGRMTSTAASESPLGGVVAPWSSSPSRSTWRGSRRRSRQASSRSGRPSRCSSSAARATSWRDWTCCGRSARSSAAVRRSTSWRHKTPSTSPSAACDMSGRKNPKKDFARNASAIVTHEDPLPPRLALGPRRREADLPERARPRGHQPGPR